jgi:hypothetical protein
LWKKSEKKRNGEERSPIPDKTGGPHSSPLLAYAPQRTCGGWMVLFIPNLTLGTSG